MRNGNQNLTIMMRRVDLGQAGCDPHLRDAAGVSVLHAAAQGCSWDVFQRLLDLGCDKDVLTTQGRSILHHAALGESCAFV